MHRFLPLAICTFVVTSASAQQGAGGVTRTETPSTAPARAVLPRVLPGTPESAFAIIQGAALDSLNGPLQHSRMRLRDARFGRLVDTQLTDATGLFTFRAVDPGSYVVELLDNDQTVLAASELINVNAGEAVTIVVKLPFRRPLLGGGLGRTASQAAALLSVAAASGVLATNVTGADISPR